MCALFLLLSLCSCGPKEPPVNEPENTEDTAEAVKDDTSDTTVQAELTFSDIAAEFPLKFVYSSGAGAWLTVLNLNEDGSFSGEYSDQDGDHIAISVFTGTFSDIKKDNEYTYSMKLGSFEAENEEGEKWSEDGFNYEASIAYGIEDGEDFRLYLPETPVDELSDSFLVWRPAVYADDNSDKLSCYGLMNVTTESGFFYSDADETDGDTTADDGLLLPEDLPQTLRYSSGAGGWETVLTLNRDGTFQGEYHDSEMGAATPEYPNGEYYISSFTGKFSDIKRENDYTFVMQLEYINTELEPGEEWIEDGIKYIAAEPVGIEGGKEFRLYLPEAPADELSEDFLIWDIPRLFSDSKAEVLTYYGLFNVTEKTGFFAYGN